MQGTGDVNVHDLHHKSHLLIRHSKQTISMNTKVDSQIGSRFGNKLVSTFFRRNMFLSSTLIRSVSNSRYPWKHSSLNPVSQTWVSTVRLVSEPEEMLTSLSLFHNMRINNSILIAKSRCTGSKMCTNLINLLIDSARLVFVCLAPHLCEKQTSPQAKRHQPFLHSFFFNYSNFDHLKILSRDNFYFLIAVITWYLFHQMNIRAEWKIQKFHFSKSERRFQTTSQHWFQNSWRNHHRTIRLLLN